MFENVFVNNRVFGRVFKRFGVSGSGTHWGTFWVIADNFIFIDVRQVSSGFVVGDDG